MVQYLVLGRTVNAHILRRAVVRDFIIEGGTPATLDYYQAGKTDLLVTWLYKLTVNSRDYSYAATIGILVFIICSLLSLITFRRSASYKNEEAFQ